MADAYSSDGMVIFAGMQGSAVCDEATRAARQIAKECNEDVFLEDDDERTTYHPDGTVSDGWEGDWD